MGELGRKFVKWVKLWLEKLLSSSSTLILTNSSRVSNLSTNIMGAIGFSQPFFGSRGAGVGGLGSYHAMQKPLLAFCLVAHKTLFRTREKTVTTVFGWFE
jgi:hypothetical protein